MHAERATTSEVRRWLNEAAQEGRADMVDKVGPIAAALQRLSEEVREERAQAAEVASDYNPHQLQALPCPALPCPALLFWVHMHAHVLAPVGMLHDYGSCTDTVMA